MMKKARADVAAVAAAVLTCLPGGYAHAQPQPFEPGVRVRVTTAAPVPNLTGTLTAMGADAFSVAPRPASEPLRIRWDDVRAFEVRERRSRRSGALRRGLWGAGVGVVIGAISLATPRPEGETWSEGALAAEAVLDGAVVGALFGLWQPGHRWRSVNVATARQHAAANPSELAPAVATPVGQVSAPRDPPVAVTLGIMPPRLESAQFPGLMAAAAVTVARAGSTSASIVGHADIEAFASATLGGARFTFRQRSPLGEYTRLSGFAQLLGGQTRGSRSGVMHSTGGRTIQPGAGLLFGRGAATVHLQVDYRDVLKGFVYDDRVPSGHVASQSGLRITVGGTFRLDY